MTKNFHAGNFNKYIYFIDDSLEVSILATPAIVKPINANSIFTFEQFEAMHLINKNYYSFTIRFTDKISNKLKIKYNNRIFRIIRIINHDEQNRFLLIYTEEEQIDE